jgi:hypothetical protein
MNPKTQKNPRYRNGPPKVVDQTPQESLLDLLPPAAGRQGLSEFPLEDRSDRLGDPPPTVFPAGEIALHPTPVGVRARPGQHSVAGMMLSIPCSSRNHR